AVPWGPFPPAPMTGRRSDEVESGEVTGGRLVVVGAFAPVVPQVERGLDGLVAARFLGMVVGGSPVGIHVVHRNCSLEAWCSLGWMEEQRARAEDADRHHGSRGDRVGHRPGGVRITPDSRSPPRVCCYRY